MLRLLANENFPGAAIAELRRRGSDVLWARTHMAGAPDTDILAQAVAEARLLVTFDEDFGELVFRRGRRASCGVVLFRIATKSPEDATRRIVTLLESRDEWRGSFSVIDEHGIRIRSLPDV
jgi:predicted nuclease of predicted toxin-antitoxin system